MSIYVDYEGDFLSSNGRELCVLSCPKNPKYTEMRLLRTCVTDSRTKTEFAFYGAGVVMCENL